MNHIILSTTLVAIIVSLTPAHAQECADLWAQCGGRGYTGPTCCVQPKPLPRYVNSLPDDSTVCKKVNSHFSQCRPACTADKPCLFQNGDCTGPSSAGDTDGRGRIFCSPRTLCSNPEWCFSDPSSCVCGGDVPCALIHTPGGCRAPGSISKPTKFTDICGGTLRRCPAFLGEQCGGKGHKAPTTCQPGLKCVKISWYYSGCQPE